MQWWTFYAPASFRLAVFWIFLWAWISVFFRETRPFLCSPGAVYQHVQSDHIHTCSPSQEERSKFVHLQYSCDELLSVRPACSTPDLAARLRSLEIWFGWPRRRTRRGGKEDFTISGLAGLEDALGEGRKAKWKQSVVCYAPITDHARSSKATDQGLCELGGSRNLFNLINVNTSQCQTFLRICCFNAQSVGTSERRTNIEHFVVDEQIDILFITETWLRRQGDEAKCVDMTPPGYSMILCSAWLDSLVVVTTTFTDGFSVCLPFTEIQTSVPHLPAVETDRLLLTARRPYTSITNSRSAVTNT